MPPAPEPTRLPSAPLGAPRTLQNLAFLHKKPEYTEHASKPDCMRHYRLFCDIKMMNLPNDFGKIRERVMGGSGSGNRWRYGTKGTVDASKRLDIRYLKQHGMLRSGYYSLSWNRGGEPSGNINVRMVAGESMTVIEDGAGMQARNGSRWKRRCPFRTRYALSADRVSGSSAPTVPAGWQ